MMKIKIDPAEIRNLAPMSLTVSRLTSRLNDPNYNINDIVEIIEWDSALTANILHWSNSAFYRRRYEIASIRVAVMRLGINNIIKLAISHSLSKTMRKKVPGYDLVEDELWRHNVAAGLTIEVIKQLTPIDVPAIAFTAALIHDIGKLIISRHLDIDSIMELRTEIRQQHCSYYQAERKLLETDHAEVGAAVAGYWKFPDELIKVIKLHHSETAEPFLLLDLVKLSNYTAKKIEEGAGYFDQENNLEAGLLQRLKINADHLCLIEQEVKSRLARSLEEFNL